MAVVAVGPQSAAGPNLNRSKDVDFAAGYVSPISYSNSSRFPLRTSSHQKLTLLTSAKGVGNGGWSAGSSPKSSKQYNLRTAPAHIDTNMTSYSSPSMLKEERTRSESRLAKLHQRASSGSSLPATPSPLNPGQSQFTTPYEDSQSTNTVQPSNSSFKSRPYIRKLSLAKDDENQGRLDLSKSVSETGGYLPGLGIQDYGSRTASEVTFSHTRRLPSHTRTTSGGSQASVSTRSFTPTQPFIHPMRQAPYTPSGQSYASSMNDEEAHESSDIVTDDGILSSQPFRSRRSESVSSTPHIQPTPLSQSHTAADLGYVPKVNTSQSNLSIKSGRSGKSSRSRLGRRSRRNTDRSDDPSGRPSVDKAFSFVSRRSNTEPEPLTRDEKIREKRRQFNEKEASKDRKQQQQEIKRRETDEAKSIKQEERRARKSSLSQHERPRLEQKSSSKIQSIRKTTRTNTEKREELRARSYDDARPANLTALPQQAVVEEKPRRAERTLNEPPGTWPRFSTWLQTRLLSCGGKG
jgi:hypothetical protein